MKAIGAPQSDIMLMYIGVVLMFSLLALFVSIPLDIVSARALSVQLASLLNFDILALMRTACGAIEYEKYYIDLCHLISLGCNMTCA